MNFAGIVPAVHDHSVMLVPDSTGVSLKVVFAARPSSAAPEVVIVMTPAPTIGARAYLLGTSLQPDSDRFAGRAPREAMYSAICVLHAPAVASASDTRARMV